MKKLALFLLLAIAPSAVFAAQERHQSINLGSVIAISDLTVSRSFTVSDAPAGMAVLSVYIDFVKNTVTRVDMQCFNLFPGVATEFDQSSCSTASGICTSDPAKWQLTVAGNKSWTWRVDMLGVPFEGDLKCTISVGAGVGTGTDTVLVRASLVTQ
jgi:hypothetical protein